MCIPKMDFEGQGSAFSNFSKGPYCSLIIKIQFKALEKFLSLMVLVKFFYICASCRKNTIGSFLIGSIEFMILIISRCFPTFINIYNGRPSAIKSF
jgi:hypothetical protein